MGFMSALGKAAGTVRESVASGSAAVDEKLGLKDKYNRTKKAVAGAAASVDGKLGVSDKFYTVTNACDKQLQKYKISERAMAANHSLTKTGDAVTNAVCENMPSVANSSKEFREGYDNAVKQVTPTRMARSSSINLTDGEQAAEAVSDSPAPVAKLDAALDSLSVGEAEGADELAPKQLDESDEPSAPPAPGGNDEGTTVKLSAMTAEPSAVGVSATQSTARVDTSGAAPTQPDDQVPTIAL